jgi:hypothetical protein
VNTFQWITLSVLGLLMLRDGLGLLFRAPTFRRDRLVRWLVWAAAFTAIANPQITSEVANAIGINRGTDLVLYVFVLAFMGTSFYFYSQHTRLHRQLTDVVRHIAIREAQKEDRPEQFPQ